MTSPPRSAREEERRLNLRTLVIASAASATAALVTSRLWIAGTWIAAAMTPVLVTLVSELLRHPTERIARSLTTEPEALPDPEAPARRVAERLRDADVPRPDPEAPVRVYRSESARRPAGRKRQIAYRAVFATAALAFVIGVLALTVPELIAGSSFGRNDGRTTLFPGSGKKHTRQNDATSPSTTDQTDTGGQTTPPDTNTTTTPTDTTTAPTDTTPTETTPTNTTGTTTTP
jgi:hypothetical protein